MSDFDTPEGRLALIERVGPTEYNRLFALHQTEMTLVTVNGHPIRLVQSERFGRLFMVGKTGRAFSSLEEAKAFARAGVEVRP